MNVASPVRLGIVGCGDVIFRSYIPGLIPIADTVEVVALCDRDLPRAEAAARSLGSLAENARCYADENTLFGEATAEAILNLTPAPVHGEVTAAALEAGLHVYSEKPLARTIDEAHGLIASARERGLLLLCAPAVMAARRYRWLRDLIESDLIGRPTLATGQVANLGPAALRAYTGDPAVFYGRDVGPVVDQGVYLLHAITGLLGPALRVQAVGGIAIPTRRAVAGRTAGQTIEVESNDHMLVHLEFGQSTFAQVLSSFAVAATKAPAIEIHGTMGSISLENVQSAADPVDIFLRDSGPLGVEGWLRSVAPPGDPPVLDDLIALGPAHFVGCLQGRDKPLLTPEHARHVLEIALKATDSAREGRSLGLETTFRMASTPVDARMLDTLVEAERR